MSPRVLYMGFGGVGVACLADMLDADFDVIGVFCRASDRRAATGVAALQTSVFTYAREHGLHTFEGTDPSAREFLDEARALRPELLISVQYDRILKPPLLAIPSHGAYNLHFGPLPRLRGCFPTKWAIINDEPAGVTFHSIDPGIDSGDVIDQVILPLDRDETDETLYHRLQHAGHELFKRQLPWLKRLEPPRVLPQDPEKSSYHPKRLPFDGVIDWTRDAQWVERFIRAYTFPPYPAAKTQLGGEEVELFAPVDLAGDLGLAPGEAALQDDGRVAIGCGRGSLLVAEVRRGGVAVPAGKVVRAAVR